MSLGILFALGTSVTWAVANVFIANTGKALGAGRAMFWALAVGALLAAVVGVVLDTGPRDFSTRNLGLLGLCVGFGMVANTGMFKAFASGHLLAVVPIVSGWSLFAALFATLFLHERVRPLQVVAAALVFAGMMVVSISAARATSDVPSPSAEGVTQRRAVLAALCAALGFGALLPLLSTLGPAFGEITASSLLFLGYTAVGIPLARLQRRSIAPPPRQIWLSVLAAGAAEVAGVAFLVLARRFAPMTVVGPLSSLASTLTVLYAWIVLRERPPRIVLLGAFLVCAGVVMLAL
ncbi:MAG: EamA family transporter [Deltaproteobacteria bacterium]|nr:EamA family transporter [Deltaproteobacteria bacterium]